MIYYMCRYKSSDKESQPDYYYNVNRQINDEILVKDPKILKERELKSWIYDPDKTKEIIERLVSDTKSKDKKSLLILDIL